MQNSIASRLAPTASVLLRRLLQDGPPIRFENNNVIWIAFNDFLEFEKTDFQESLIARKAEDLGCSRVLSFDKAAKTARLEV